MSIHEQLSSQFYKWELRGRGWKVWPEPVSPEPPFHPLSYSLPEAVDDGRRPSFLGSVFRNLAGAKSSAPVPPVIPEKEEEEPTPFARDGLIEIETRLPANLEMRGEHYEPFLRNLALAREPIAFEVVGVPGAVSVKFVTHPSDVDNVQRHLSAFFPDAGFYSHEATLEESWWSTEGDEELVVEFGLAREFVLPLESGKVEPFIGLIAALSGLKPSEIALFQVLFSPVQNPWGRTMSEAVTLPDGSPFFVNAPGITAAAAKKASRPLYAAVIRIAARTGDWSRSVAIARDLAASLRVFANPNGNELIPLSNDEYPLYEHVDDLLRRQSRRSGMILSAEELIGFIHLPSSTVRSPALVRQRGKSKEAPKRLTRGPGFCLGENVHLNQRSPVFLSPDERMRHMHILGASGTGKSTLLFNLITQDIRNGEGIGVLDPHGDLIDSILAVIPPERVNDVVLVDPADMEFSVPFNILSAHNELEKNLLASDLVSVFQRLSSSWGEQMGSVLRNAILAFLESPRGGTLADLRRFLLEPAFRREHLATVTDPEITYYWEKAFPQLAGNKSIGSILTRLDNFLGRKPIRAMVSQKDNRIDFGEIMDGGKIFLAKLSRGLVGQENSYLLGSLFVAKIQQVAMGRQAQAATSRRPFYLFIDEFANFITASMAEILTSARKYRLGLVLAHQDLQQLDREKEVASALMSNAYTRVVFRVGHDDARKLATGFTSFEPQDFQNLDKGQAICRIERSDCDFNISVPLSPKTDEAAAEIRRTEVIEASRRRYGTPKVESAIVAPVAPAAKPPLEIGKPQESAALSIAPPPAVAPSVPAEPVRESKESIAAKPEMPPGVTSDLSAQEEVPSTKSGRSPHEEAKDRIMAAAQACGYSVEREKLILDGKGRVDLTLTRGKSTIACQICFTTRANHEVENARKCLDACFSHIAVIFPAAKKLPGIKSAIRRAFSSAELDRIGFYLLDGFISQLSEWAKADPEGGAIEAAKPQKREDISLEAHSPEERQIRERELIEKLRKAMKGEPPK